MLTSRHIKKVAKLMSQTSGHGSCYPYVPPLEIEVPISHEPVAYVQCLIDAPKSSFAADLKRDLHAGKRIYGKRGNQGIVVWRESDGEVKCFETYDPAERAREKQASRDEDQRRLDAGEVTREELRRENSMFAGVSVTIGRPERDH